MKQTNHMGWPRFLSAQALLVMALAGFVFLGSNTIGFFTWAFPPEWELISYLGIFFTSLGALIWAANWKLNTTYWFSNQLYRDERTYGIALAMMVLDIVAEVGVGGFEMVRITMLKSATSLTTNETNMAVILVAILVGVNVGALLAFHLLDHQPETDKVLNNDGSVSTVESKPAPKSEPAKSSAILDRRPLSSPAPLGANPSERGNGNGGEKRTFNLDVPPVDLVNQTDRRGEIVLDGKTYWGVNPDFERVMLASGQLYQPCLIIVKDENRSLDPYSAEYRKVWEAVMRQPLPLAVGATKPS